MRHILICALIAMTSAASAQEVAQRDKDVLGTCLFMSTDAMVNDWACVDLMKRWHVTTADMVMMKACKAMDMERMNRDVDCAQLRAKHPDIVTAGLRR